MTTASTPALAVAPDGACCFVWAEPRRRGRSHRASVLRSRYVDRWTVPHYRAGYGRARGRTRRRCLAGGLSRRPHPCRPAGNNRPAQSRSLRRPPSPRNANYSIDVTLDHAARTLTGREVLTWRNISPVTTSELRFHLYYNAWRNTRSTWMRGRARGRGLAQHGRPEADWGWIDVTRIRLLGVGDRLPIDLTPDMTFIAPDDGNTDDRTVLAVALPEPVAPGATVNVEVEWTSRVPRTFARTGTIGNYYFIAQWFPKIGVLEADGWNCPPVSHRDRVLRRLRSLRHASHRPDRVGARCHRSRAAHHR